MKPLPGAPRSRPQGPASLSSGPRNASGPGRASGERAASGAGWGHAAAAGGRAAPPPDRRRRVLSSGATVRRGATNALNYMSDAAPIQARRYSPAGPLPAAFSGCGPRRSGGE